MLIMAWRIISLHHKVGQTGNSLLLQILTMNPLLLLINPSLKANCAMLPSLNRQLHLHVRVCMGDYRISLDSNIIWITSSATLADSSSWMTCSCTSLTSLGFLCMLGHPMKIEGLERGSLLEDQTWSDNLPKSFCFSTEYESEAMEADYLLDDITSNGFSSEGTSVEESVLKELEIATTQLSDKTRICFRDAFYRLAKNSEQNPVAINQQENLNVQTHSPKWTISEEKIRSRKKRTTESETNTIDRTLANLIFDKMDTNVRNFSVFATPDSENVIEVTGKLSACSSESQLQIHCFSQSYVSTK